ncbi:hypothetical protein [Flavobacterium arsenatis]|nr:hypothetical protein [Flavobacterium arsenatis]
MDNDWRFMLSSLALTGGNLVFWNEMEGRQENGFQRSLNLSLLKIVISIQFQLAVDVLKRENCGLKTKKKGYLKVDISI